MIKQQLNQYYACYQTGYIKYKNVNLQTSDFKKQLLVSSKCNEILPYKVHKIQVKDPVFVNQSQVSTFLPQVQKQLKQKQSASQNQKNQITLNYSFSLSHLEFPNNKIMQKDQVHSIHIDDKTSIKTKINENKNKPNDLSQSTMTNIKRYKNDMKRSLFSTNLSNFTQQITSQKNEKIQIIISQLIKQKAKRKDMEEKYQILFNMVNNNASLNKSQILNKEHVKTEENYYQENKKYQNNRTSKKQKDLKTERRKYYIKNYSQMLSEDEHRQSPIIIRIDEKKQRKLTEPIIVKIGSQKQSSSIKRHRKIVSFSPQEQQQIIVDNKQSELEQIKQKIQQLNDDVLALHENIEYLENKLQQQEARHEKQNLYRQIQSKDREIERIIKLNQKIKENYDMQLLNNHFAANNNQIHNTVQFWKSSKNTILVSFFISLIVILLFSTIKSTIC